MRPLIQYQDRDKTRGGGHEENVKCPSQGSPERSSKPTSGITVAEVELAQRV